MKPATEITLLGLIGDERGVPLNLSSFALPPPLVTGPRPPVIAVLGTSMNSGKTTTARFLVIGLQAAGLVVGYAKLTGTGAGHDYWSMVDAGAAEVVDFTDAGLVSTYLTPLDVLERTSLHLIGHLAAEQCEVVVVEVADGLLQVDNLGILRSPIFQALLDKVVFAAGDPMAAKTGIAMLRQLGFQVVAVSGLMTASPLPTREAIEELDIPVLTKDELLTPAIALGLLDQQCEPVDVVMPGGGQARTANGNHHALSSDSQQDEETEASEWAGGAEC
jgi:hypothetical protein